MELAQVLCLAIGSLLANGNAPTYRINLSCKMMPHVIDQSKKNNIRPTLLLAKIHMESGWNPRAISRSNACGLTQIVPKWTGSPRTGVPRLTCKQLHDPKTSITMGARLLRFWIKNHGRGNERIGLCGYNKGYRCRGPNPHPTGWRYAILVLAIEKKIKRKIHNAYQKSIQH